MELCAPEVSTKAKYFVKSAMTTTLGKQEFMAATLRAGAVQKVGQVLLDLPGWLSTFSVAILSGRSIFFSSESRLVPIQCNKENTLVESIPQAVSGRVTVKELFKF